MSHLSPCARSIFDSTSSTTEAPGARAHTFNPAAAFGGAEFIAVDKDVKRASERARDGEMDLAQTSRANYTLIKYAMSNFRKAIGLRLPNAKRNETNMCACVHIRSC